MADADELASWLAKRSEPNADRIAIDAAITQRFGREQAVMFTDLVGFSRMVEAFGIVHFLQLIAESETLFLPIISQHGGRCLKREGDSLLAVFDDTVAAANAALAMVAATHAINPGRAAEERLEVCIGLGFGTVLCIDGQEVWGREVNAASKLGEDVAKGGEILVTDAFRAAAPCHQFADHGLLYAVRPIFRLLGLAPRAAW